MKEALLILGGVVGSILTLAGGGVTFMRFSQDDTEGMLTLFWLCIGIPCLVVGVPMLGLCVWGFIR